MVILTTVYLCNLEMKHKSLEPAENPRTINHPKKQTEDKMFILHVPTRGGLSALFRAVINTPDAFGSFICFQIKVELQKHFIIILFKNDTKHQLFFHGFFSYPVI